ncbi:MAG: lipopolysaccharide core heptose(I) kinase RfaP [Gammaproteobacteria bacterium]|nr:lipopolysaccharide core heptose(I) kinase RfaP [Gammaproteobacteria bacterium]
MLILPAEWTSLFENEKEAFDYFFNQTGEVFRDHKNRKTLRFFYRDHFYFIKIHRGVGWLEIIKNSVVLKKPIVSAKNEWDALNKLKEVGVCAVEAVAFAERGLNPATKCSFIITKEKAPHIECDALFKKWGEDKTTLKLKRELIKKIAVQVSKMHAAGINHRDLYLCHFIVKTEMDVEPCLIDLHRAQVRKTVPERWIIKDLSSLYFSAQEASLSLRDCLRFLKIYSGNVPLKTLFSKEKKRLKKVVKKSQALYQKTYGLDNDHTRVFRKLADRKVGYVASLESFQFIYFLNHLEAFFSENSVHYLKKGDTTTVILTEYAGKRWVIKRYNCVGWWGKIKRALTKTRASRCWYYAHLLLSLGIHTPAPIAYVEKKKGWFYQESFFISEYVEGVNALDYFKSANQHKQYYAHEIMKQINKLFSSGITHGDMKATNIILSSEKVYFIDLDAMKKHSDKKKFNHAKNKDMIRFQKNWLACPEIKILFQTLEKGCPPNSTCHRL